MLATLLSVTSLVATHSPVVGRPRSRLIVALDSQLLTALPEAFQSIPVFDAEQALDADQVLYRAWGPGP